MGAAAAGAGEAVTVGVALAAVGVGVVATGAGVVAAGADSPRNAEYLESTDQGDAFETGLDRVPVQFTDVQKTSL